MINSVHIASFSWAKYSGAVVFAALVGGVLGALMSLLVEWVFGKHMSDRVKGAFVFVGVIVGYSVIKAFYDGA